MSEADKAACPPGEPIRVEPRQVSERECCFGRNLLAPVTLQPVNCQLD